MFHRHGSYRYSWLALSLLAALTSAGCQHLQHDRDTEQVGHLHRHKLTPPAPPSVVTVSAVSISGLVRSPGPVSLPAAGLRLVDAISQAGGVHAPAPFADSENLVLISLTRGDQVYHFSLTLLKQDRFVQDVKVRPGDSINVQEWLNADLDLAKGRILFRRNVEAPKGRYTDWLFDQAREAEVTGFVIGLDEQKKKFDNFIANEMWTEAGNVLRAWVGPTAMYNRTSKIRVGAKVELSSAEGLEAYARRIANDFIAMPIRTAHRTQDQNFDREFLLKYYADRKQDTSKRFDVPFTLLGGGVYPLNERVQQADLSPDTPSFYHPTLLAVKRAFIIGKEEPNDAIVILERTIGGRAHTFAFRAEHGTEFNPLASILVFPGDRVTVSQTPTLSIVLLEQLRPMLEPRKN